VAQVNNYADYQKYNFFRSPDWRWERVLSLVDRPGDIPGRCSRRDDDIVRKAKTFLARRKVADEMQLERMRFEDPGLFYAYEFYQRAQEDPESNMYIQARILARQTPEEVAAILGILPEAVQWYCDLFFDVIPHLDKRDWITKQVIIPALIRTAGAVPAEADMPQHTFKDSSIARPFMDGTLKFFSYYGGPYVADILINGLQSGKPLARPDDIDNWWDHTTGTILRRRTAQAAQMFEVNKYNVMELFATHTKLMEIARSEDNQDQARTDIDRHIKATIEDIPWASGADGAELHKGTLVGRFDAMAGELRDSELLLVASGQVAATVAPDNFPTKLPPPSKDKRTVVVPQNTDI